MLADHLYNIKMDTYSKFWNILIVSRVVIVSCCSHSRPRYTADNEPKHDRNHSAVIMIYIYKRALYTYE
jgi:hypothetical protein